MTGQQDSAKTITLNIEYNVFLAFISLLAFVNSILLVLFEPGQLRTIALAYFLFASVVILFDVARLAWHYYRTRMAPFSGRFAWLFLVGSVPLPFFSSLRLVGYYLSARYLSSTEVGEVRDRLRIQQASGAITAVAIAAIIVTELASLWVLRVEPGYPGANIETAGDALWWSIVTISTVGYGDQYPVTTTGRTAGAFLIMSGVLIFTTFTSYLSQSFLRRHAARQKHGATVSAAESEYADMIAALRARLDHLEAIEAPPEAISNVLKTVDNLLAWTIEKQ